MNGHRLVNKRNTSFTLSLINCLTLFKANFFLTIYYLIHCFVNSYFEAQILNFVNILYFSKLDSQKWTHAQQFQQTDQPYFKERNKNNTLSDMYECFKVLFWWLVHTNIPLSWPKCKQSINRADDLKVKCQARLLFRSKSLLSFLYILQTNVNLTIFCLSNSAFKICNE